MATAPNNRDPPTRADLKVMVVSAGEAVERLIRKAERLNHERDAEVLREHVGIWASKMESINHIRTADGAVEMAEGMADIVKAYGGLEESYDVLVGVAEFAERRAAYMLSEAQLADDLVPGLLARVEAAGSLTPAKRGGLLRSIRHSITELRKSADFCYNFDLPDELRLIEGVIQKYRALADDLVRGRPAWGDIRGTTNRQVTRV